MADGPNIVLTPATFARLEKMMDYVEGMMRAAIPNGSNGPRGPVFPIPRPVVSTSFSQPQEASLDLLQADVNVVTATPFINCPTNRGTSTILEFAAATVSGTAGGNLQFAAPVSNRVTIVANGTNWEQGYVRFHS